MGLLEPHGRGRRLFRRDALSADRPAIIVHSLAHAAAALRAAVEVQRPVILVSAPDAGIAAGPGWFRELIAAAREAVPGAQSEAWLDCGDDAGAAQAAIRAAVEAVIFTGPEAVAASLADIAAQAGIGLVTARPQHALDLADRFFDPPGALYARVAAYLSAGARCR